MLLAESSARAARPRLRAALGALLALGLALLACACSPAPRGWVILDPQDPERDYDIDLGRLQFGEVRLHVVRLRNEEGRPVAVRQVTAG